MNLSSLKNKIRSKKGATLVFALMALIVCVMISAVIVYTAFSNVGRIKNTQSDEQNYLSVSSAVKLFKDSLEGDSVSYEETYVVTITETYDANWETLISRSTSPDEPEPTFSEAVYHDVAPTNTILSDVLKAWAKKSSEQKLEDIAIKGNENLPNIATVEAEMVFNPVNNKMTITFGIKDDSSSEADKFITVMTMDLTKSTSDPITTSSEKKEQKDGNNVKTITVTKKVVHTIRWENCVISKQK
ncbi:MAG: hypothetical protein GX328_00240 [Clostridiaceae bacterium]|nr:hypothetical protein [Clostridiaceae bacterium]